MAGLTAANCDPRAIVSRRNAPHSARPIFPFPSTPRGLTPASVRRPSDRKIAPLCARARASIATLVLERRDVTSDSIASGNCAGWRAGENTTDDSTSKSRNYTFSPARERDVYDVEHVRPSSSFRDYARGSPIA